MRQRQLDLEIQGSAGGKRLHTGLWPRLHIHVYLCHQMKLHQIHPMHHSHE